MLVFVAGVVVGVILIAMFRRGRSSGIQTVSTLPTTAPAISFQGETASVTVNGRSVEIPPGVSALIRERNLIAAIKEVRAATGLGLKESKDVVEELARSISV